VFLWCFPFPAGLLGAHDTIRAKHLQVLAPIQVALKYIAAPISTLRGMVSKPWSDYPR